MSPRPEVVHTTDDFPLVSKRSEERLTAALPVTLASNAQGVTRDISASGLFFETPQEIQEGEFIDFTVEFEDAPGQRKWRMRCHAQVVRIERADGGSRGVAAKILDSRFELQK